MDATRRRALRAAGTGLVAAVAGCLGGSGGGTPTSSPTATPGTPTPAPDADGDGVADADDQYPDDDRRSRQFGGRDATLKVAKGSWHGFQLAYDAQGVLTYELTVTAGPNVDVFVFPQSDLEAFRNNAGFAVYRSMTRFNTDAASVETVIPKGRYVLAVDNSNRGRAKPGSGDATTATVDFLLEQAV